MADLTGRGPPAAPARPSAPPASPPPPPPPPPSPPLRTFADRAVSRGAALAGSNGPAGRLCRCGERPREALRWCPPGRARPGARPRSRRRQIQRRRCMCVPSVSSISLANKQVWILQSRARLRYSVMAEICVCKHRTSITDSVTSAGPPQAITAAAGSRCNSRWRTYHGKILYRIEQKTSP